jgi:hypothetical protein
MTRVSLFSIIALAAAFASAGCGADRAGQPAARAESGAKECPRAWRAGWQRLADRVDAPVYCPGWLPSPLTGDIAGVRTSINAVSKDGSYLIGFAWKEREDEVHVNLRGYPGKTAIPTCRQVEFKAGKEVATSVPCFSDAGGHKRASGIDATVYTVGQDADRWHVSYVWRHRGSLYVLSEHVAPPYSYTSVGRNLDRMLRSLALVEPRSS